MEPLDFMDPEPPIEVQKALSEPVCPNCGNTGIGLLGVHEWVDWVQVGYDEWEPVHQFQEEYGTPCPTCGKEADDGTTD